jgi:catechol 2,3-dioxygenase-like lactoylglutathione lyase family enzyme
LYASVEERIEMNENNSINSSSSWVQSIFAVTLIVEDLEITKQFYQKTFGLPVHFEDANSVVFQFGALLINLLKVSEANELMEPAKVATRDAGSRFVFTIPVDDVDETCVKLAECGVKFLNGPMDRPWGVRTASFMDPAGYIWEIAK